MTCAAGFDGSPEPDAVGYAAMFVAEGLAELARASGDGLGGQQWGSMAGGDDDDSYSSRSSRSYSSRSGDSLYDEFEDFQ